MLILEFESAIVRSLLERYLWTDDTLSDDYWFCDFDGVQFHVKLGREKRDKKTVKSGIVVVELRSACAEAINEYGGEEVFEKLYGQFKVPASVKEGDNIQYTHAIEIHFNEMRSDDEKKHWVELAARLKANLMAAPFLWVAQQIQDKSNFVPFEIPYRASTGESMYFVPATGGAFVTYSIRFADPGDRVLASVFLKELQVGRTKLPGAPVIEYSPKPPEVLEPFKITGDMEAFYFVTFSLQGTHVIGDKKEKARFLLPLFRDYLHYHIKCAKMHMHQRMRTRAEQLLQVMENAKPEPKTRVRRLASGKKA